ncbi:MAG: bifunctional ADP-dependent NAD(P)H-hydrate dehydratase/NAD(P)H-hydrate epimerase [Saprospirales bacterium]|nr:bifunctional ADP-dependent NAD(P)H-hydrate dehydratase/NAD(P)H-hydrate epimerase [Saprospirales bacterium]
MKILTAEQIRQADAYTIANEPITSIELMERAARTFAKWFERQFPDKERQVIVFCGPGNNGGDGLAIARMLIREFYDVKTWVLEISPKKSEDFRINFKNLKKQRRPLASLKKDDPFPVLPKGAIVIDAIFGSGLNRPVEGYWAELINWLNGQPVTRVSVDIPSGMFADAPTTGAAVKAHYTFTFEVPKLGFLFPENNEYVGNWTCESIGLHPDFIASLETPWHFVTQEMVRSMLHQRRKYAHKGTFGHALLVAGSYGKVGAGILAARACLRSGAGLVTIHAPSCAYQILQIAFPEAMVMVDEGELFIQQSRFDFSRYSAVGIGPGIGTADATALALRAMLEQADHPLVLDADALNLLARHPEFWEHVPENSILTPHPKEFERLFGKTSDSFERNALQREMARKYKVFIVLKGAYTCTSTPEGICYFNSTGNPGMATGGSGDVLTGMLTGLLAQGYSPFETCVLGVYLHGLAGDLAAEELQQEALLASDIISHIGRAFLKLRSDES